MGYVVVVLVLSHLWQEVAIRLGKGVEVLLLRQLLL